MSKRPAVGCRALKHKRKSIVEIACVLTIPEAVSLVLQASVIGGGGEVLILDMGQYSIRDIEGMLKEFGAQLNSHSGPEADLKTRELLKKHVKHCLNFTN